MEFVTKINKGGRITFPARLRNALQVEIGDAVVLRWEEDGVRVIPLRRAVQMAQDKVRQYVPQQVSLVEELLAERRREVDHE